MTRTTSSGLFVGPFCHNVKIPPVVSPGSVKEGAPTSHINNSVKVKAGLLEEAGDGVETWGFSILAVGNWLVVAAAAALRQESFGVVGCKKTGKIWISNKRPK